MLKQKLILYFWELDECPYYSSIFNNEYDLKTVKTEKAFLKKIYSLPIDAAIICFCSAREDYLDTLLRFDALTGPIPFIVCSKSLNPEFIRKATQKGVERFLICDMEPIKIRSIVDEAIRETRLKEYLKRRWPGCLDSSFYINKLIDEIIQVFPHRMRVRELAARLGIDRGWLCRLCKRTFDKPPTVLIRRIWIYQALRMMQNTNLKNIDIALLLNYSEESSMAREFRKELGYSPNIARKQLIKHPPEELLT